MNQFLLTALLSCRCLRVAGKIGTKGFPWDLASSVFSHPSLTFVPSPLGRVWEGYCRASNTSPVPAGDVVTAGVLGISSVAADARCFRLRASDYGEFESWTEDEDEVMDLFSPRVEASSGSSATSGGVIGKGSGSGGGKVKAGRSGKSKASKKASQVDAVSAIESEETNGEADDLKGAKDAVEGLGQVKEVKKIVEVSIPEEKLDISFTRSSGSGGQNVNKLSTKVEIRFSVPDADWLEDDVKERLMEQQSGRVNKNGELVVTSQEHRTQRQNRLTAVQKLTEMVKQAVVPPKERNMRTGIGKKGKAIRKAEKRFRSQVKENRKKVQDW